MGMIQVVGSELQAGMFFSDNKFIKVRVELEESSETPSGYQWTSAGGPPSPLEPGTMCSAVIILDRERPIDLVFSR
jgi:HlyD family secretion protein